MFQSHLPNRVQTTSPRRRLVRSGRKLHVELMERRLMLSAAPLELQPTSLSLDLFSGLNIKPNPASGQISVVSNPTDGGFINADAGVATIAFNNHFGDATYSNADFGQNGVDPLFDFTGWTLAAGGTLDVAAPQGFSDGLHPWTIRSPESALGDTSHYTSLVRPIGSGGDEGGVIPIGFADSQPELKPSPTSKSAELPLVTSVSPLAPTRRVTPSESSISGEWARSVVFEFTGEATHNRAESARIGETRSSEIRNTEKSARPVSSDDSQRAIDATQAQIDRLPVTAEPRADAQEQPVTETSAPNAHDVSAPVYNKAIDQLFKSSRVAERPVGAGPHGAVVNLSSQCSADAFPQLSVIATDEIMGTKTPAIEPVGKNKWWRESWIAVPLVMVLALERLAALNSRRCTIDDAAFAKRRPRASAGT